MSTRKAFAQRALFADGADLPLFSGNPAAAAPEPVTVEPARDPGQPATWGWACTLEELEEEPQP